MSQAVREIQIKNPKMTREQLLRARPKLDYSDGRTQQAFKEETDINRIMARAQKTGTISHLAKNEAFYGDFADYDFFENQRKLTLGRELFDTTPSEIRKEFDNDPQKFFAYVNDPANKDNLERLLPALAAPGRQLMDVSGKTPPDTKASRDAASEPTASETPSADASAAPTPPDPSADQ